MIGRMKWIGLVLALGGCDAVFGPDVRDAYGAGLALVARVRECHE